MPEEARHYLAYWLQPQVEAARDSGEVLDHSAGGQLDRVKPGDVVWVSSSRNGHLFLNGRILVEHQTDQRGASRLLRRTNLWEAPHHIVAKPGTAEPIREIDLTSIAPKLRFHSSTGRDRLTLVRGRVNAEQLQQMRVLSPSSAELLESLWRGRKFREPRASDLEKAIHHGAGFGVPEQNAKVESAAEKKVTRWYRSRGWTVRNVSPFKRGYDLECLSGGSRHDVEVKGISGTADRFLITAGEVSAARANPNFRVAIVRSALTADAQIDFYTGEEFLAKFSLAPLLFRAQKSRSN